MTQTAQSTEPTVANKRKLRSLNEILAVSPQNEAEGRSTVVGPRVITTIGDVLAEDLDLYVEPTVKAKLLRKYGRKSEEWREYLTALFEETNNVTVKGEARKFFDEFAHLFG